jgi:hypothetical protein
METHKIYLIVVRYYLPPVLLRKYVNFVKSSIELKGFNVEVISIDLNVVGEYQLMDFSGYSEGIRYCAENAIKVFINDTFFIKHPWKFFLFRFTQHLDLLNSMPSPCAIGVVENSTDLLILDELNPSRKHMSTFFFALNDEASVLFRDILEDLPKSEFESPSWIDKEQERNNVLRLIIHSHLTEKASVWAWSKLHQVDSLFIVTKKKVCVIAEYKLSQAILSHKGCIIPINGGVKCNAYYLMKRFLNKISIKGR